MTFLTNVHKNNKPLTSFGASPFTTWLFGFRPLSVRLETNWGCILWCIVKGVYTSGKASKACQTTEPLLCKQTAFRFKIWKANMSILWDDCVTNEFGNDVYYTSYNKGRTILVDLSDVVYWFKKKKKKNCALLLCCGILQQPPEVPLQADDASFFYSAAIFSHYARIALIRTTLCSVVSGLFSSKVSVCSRVIKNSAEARLGGMIEQSLLKQTWA